MNEPPHGIKARHIVGDLDPVEPDQMDVPLPTVIELCAALDGRVPARHPARKILLAAWSLSRVKDKLIPLIVTLDDSSREECSAREVLAETGLDDICTMVRVLLIERIDYFADSRYRYLTGHMIAEVVCTRREWRNLGSPTRSRTEAQHITLTRRRATAALRTYRKHATGRTWAGGPAITSSASARPHNQARP